MFKYYWSKLIKIIPGSSIINTTLEKPSKIEPRCTVINSSFGCYSYCGYNCKILNCKIGRFTSIADKVVIGAAHHPVQWVSTSPAFYRGKDSIPKDLAKLEYDYSAKETVVGSDVWIGEGSYIKDGITIGNGAVIGMGSVVTKDVPDYAIVAGVPATIIRYRFDDSTIKELLERKWWTLSLQEIQGYSEYMNDVNAFLAKVKDRNEA